jgi:hypothetical protein
MIIKVYHDGSGKQDNPGSRFVTLAGFCGSDKTWDALEREFCKVLVAHKAPTFSGCPYIHMKEAWLATKGDFSGWSVDRLSELVMELLSLIPEDLQFICCTVDLGDFERAKSGLAHIKSAPQACSEWCFSKLRPPHSEEAKEPTVISLYYDCSEPFLRHVDKHWRSIPERKRQGWKRQVAIISSVANSRLIPAMQLADVAAWVTNRHFSAGDMENWWLALELSTLRNARRVLYEYKNLLADFAPGGKLAPQAQRD